MKNKDKTKEQLINELVEMRKRVSELEESKTERNRAEKEIQKKTKDMLLINSLNNAINRGASLREIINILTRETSKILSGYGATVYLLSEDKKYLVMQNLPLTQPAMNKIEELIGMKIPVMRIPLKEDSMYLKMLQSGKPRLINDPEAIKGLIAECTENKVLKKIAPNIYNILGIRSVIAVPLVSDGESIGLLDISRSEPFTESDLHRLTAISGQVTAAIGHKNMEESIQGSEKRYRDLFEKSPASITLMDKSGTIIDCNKSTEKLTGYSKDEIIGKHFEKLLTLDSKDLPELKKKYGDLLKGMEGEPFELEIIGKYGERHWIRIMSSLLMKDDAIVGFQIISGDITERKNAEARMEHLNAVLRAIRNVNQLIVKEKDRNSLLQGACNSLIKTRGFQSAWIALMDESNKLVVSTECGAGKDFLHIAEKLKRSEFVYCIRKALAKPGVLAIKNPQLTCTDCPLLAKCSGSERMIVRLEHGRKVYGFLSVSPPENFITDSEDKELLKEVAEDIAFALYGIELEEERKKTEEALQATNEQLKYLLASTSVAIYTSKTSGDYGATTITENVKQMTGYEPEEFIENSNFWIDHVHPEDRQRILDELQHLFKQGKYTYEYRFLHKDGAYMWIRDEMNLIMDEAGNPVEIVGYWIDVTEQKTAEEAIKESEERFRNLAEQSPNMIFINRKGRIVYANKKCEEVMNYKREEFYLPDFDFLTLIAPEYKDLMIAQFMKHMEGEEAPPREYAIITKEGKRIDAIITTKLIKYRGENDILGIVTDITELKKTENKLKQTAEDLARSNAEMEELVYSVAHDLRTPLRSVRGFSDALLEDYAGRMDPLAQDYIHRIIAAAMRMDTLIHDLLHYSRISHFEMELKPVKLESVVKDVLAEREPKLKEKEAFVAVEKPLPDVVGNPNILSQVIENLLSNAVKFVAPKVKPQVRIWAEKRRGRVRMWVEDNGIGIAPEYHERIFSIFERLHCAEEYPGTGIGLAIVRKGVERMRGKVGVESDIGKGSRFWIELPKVKKKS